MSWPLPAYPDALLARDEPAIVAICMPCMFDTFFMVTCRGSYPLYRPFPVGDSHDRNGRIYGFEVTT